MSTPLPVFVDRQGNAYSAEQTRRIESRDAVKTAKFFVALGFTAEKQADAEGRAFVLAKATGVRLEIYPALEPQPTDDAMTLIVADAAVASSRAAAVGGTIGSPLKDIPGGKKCVVVSPEGVRVIVAEKSGSAGAAPTSVPKPESSSTIVRTVKAAPIAKPSPKIGPASSSIGAATSSAGLSTIGKSAVGSAAGATARASEVARKAPAIAIKEPDPFDELVAAENAATTDFAIKDVSAASAQPKSRATTPTLNRAAAATIVEDALDMADDEPARLSAQLGRFLPEEVRTLRAVKKATIATVAATAAIGSASLVAMLLRLMDPPDSLASLMRLVISVLAFVGLITAAAGKGMVANKSIRNASSTWAGIALGADILGLICIGLLYVAEISFWASLIGAIAMAVSCISFGRYFDLVAQAMEDPVVPIVARISSVFFGVNILLTLAAGLCFGLLSVDGAFNFKTLSLVMRLMGYSSLGCIAIYFGVAVAALTRLKVP